MDRLNAAECMFFLELIQEKFGRGYSSIKEIGQLQAKLSILAQLANDLGNPGKRIEWREIESSQQSRKKVSGRT